MRTIDGKRTTNRTSFQFGVLRCQSLDIGFCPADGQQLLEIFCCRRKGFRCALPLPPALRHRTQVTERQGNSREPDVDRAGQPAIGE